MGSRHQGDADLLARAGADAMLFIMVSS